MKRKWLNKIFSKLPFQRNGLYIDNSHRYFIINSLLLRAGQSVPNALYFGQRIFDLLSVNVPLNLKCRVLDVGCGDGRVASAFARKTNKFTGIYSGFDIDKDRINALIKLFESNDRFSFLYADIFHSSYNKGGKLSAENYKYRYPDNSFDLIFFNSVFSHLKLEAINNNLRESYRCLDKNGKVWATFYILDEHYNPEYEGLNWQFDTAYDEGFTAVRNNPEGCVAYEKEKILRIFHKIGFSVEKYIAGNWKKERQTLDNHEQDILVLTKII